MSVISDFEKLKGAQEMIEGHVERLEKRLRGKQREKKRLEMCRLILTEVTQETQVYFKEIVENMVTMAVRAVYDKPLNFKLDFVRKANRLYCIPSIMEGSYEYDIEYDKGGGLLDVISFAFRVVLWSLKEPRSEPVFILDEPMLGVGKGELLLRSGRVISHLSHELDLQVIIVTHEPQLALIADKAFRVLQDGQESEVIEWEVQNA